MKTVPLSAVIQFLLSIESFNEPVPDVPPEAPPARTTHTETALPPDPVPAPEDESVKSGREALRARIQKRDAP